jgi:c-di-GMP-binding flagellar brake protein YcgR
MSYSRELRRRTTRYDFPSTIEFVLDPPLNNGKIHKGVTINISTSGLAAYVFDDLPEGQKIVIQTSLPVEHRNAMICWTKKEDQSFFLSGLKFV